MGKFLKSTTGRVLAVVVLLFILYTLAGFFLAPHLVRSLLIGNIQKTLGATPEVGEIRVNPLKLQLEVRDFSLPAANGGKLLGFEHFSVHVSPAAIWRRALVFGDIVLDKPFINAIVAADGSVNLMQLRPKNTAAAPPAQATPSQAPPRIEIGLFRVSDGTVSYEDNSRSPSFATRLEPIEFDLHDFSTGTEGGLFDFSGKTRNDERIEWHGHLSVPQLESDGQIRLSGIEAQTIWDYIESRVNFAISSGKINLDAAYRVSIKESTDLHLDLRQLDVAGLGIRAKAGSADLISVPQLHVGATSLDLAHHDVNIDSIALQGLQVSAWLNADKSLNLLGLAGAATSAAKKASAAPMPATPIPAAPVAAGPPAPAWRVALRDFALQDAAVSFEDRGARPGAKFALAPISLDVQGASLDLSAPVQVKLDAGINATGHVRMSGSVTPAPLAADLGVQLSAFDLTALQPYIGQLTAMSLLSGKLGADLKVKYGAARPALAVKGAISVTGLHTIDNALQDDFLNWDSLELKNFSYQQQPVRLEIDRVVARKLYSRTIVEADSTLNVERVLRISKPAPGKPGPPAMRAVPAAASAATKPAPAGGPSTYMAIHKVEIRDGTVNFSDFSINPNFSAGIQKLNGSVSGLSSRPDSRATVDLKGEVDEFSPVAIAGNVNLLSPALYSDVTMSFRNIELSIINPYSGKFAGYNITKGKLTTELHYKLDGRKLDAQHHITIDQLEFGDKTASKDAVSLPIKLAVALLKDRNGVINLDVPVTGSLDDPKFSIWPIIGKVLTNILEKLVTAPFAMLGSLFSAGPDLQFVDFQPGSAALDAAAAARLKTIAKALAERPQLKLDVPIAVAAAIDKPALAEVKFQAELQAAQKSKTSATPSLSLLRKLFVNSTGAEPKYPDDLKTDAQKTAFLENEVRKGIAVSDSELRDLGQQRALTLQSALLTDTQLEPERVFLVQSDKAKSEGGVVRLEMSLH